MNVSEAKAHIAEILLEERANPTAQYKFADNSGSSWFPMSATQLLAHYRTQKPRKVQEDTAAYVSGGMNCQLLVALFSRFNETDRKELMPHVLMHIHDLHAFQKRPSLRHYPKWLNFVSELPLVVEFCVRVGEIEKLLAYVVEARLSPGLVLLLMQLEDLIAFNWNALTREQLEKTASSLVGLHISSRAAADRGGPPKILVGGISEQAVALEVQRLCGNIAEECREAKYLHLKADLMQMSNLEVNQDKAAVESHLKQQGFSDVLVQSLNHAEELYRSSSPFELKSSLGHLRSFLEVLHSEAATKIQSAATPAPSGWGSTVSFLRQQSVLSSAEEKCVTGLYTLISDEAVHPLIAAKEYARLSRNMVIEYGLLFLK